MKNELEQMYIFAEKFQADVVHCERNYESNNEGKVYLVEEKISDKPCFLSLDLATRINHYLKFGIRSPTWLKLLKRDFLTKNEINFVPIIQEDNDWTLRLLCLAEKFLIIPDACYIRRMRADSITNSSAQLNRYIRKWGERIVIGTNITDKFMRGLEFFKLHPEYRYAVLNFYAMIDLNRFAGILANVPPHIIQETLQDMFVTEMGENAALISYLITNNIILARKLITPPLYSIVIVLYIAWNLLRQRRMSFVER